jgi:hypothetical protein
VNYLFIIADSRQPLELSTPSRGGSQEMLHLSQRITLPKPPDGRLMGALHEESSASGICAPHSQEILKKQNPSKPLAKTA